MKLLRANHPHAFPQSVSMSREGNGWCIKGNCKPNALTWEEFEKLYAECGEVLHRGSIRSLELSSQFDEATYKRVVDWQRKLVDLLNEHLIATANGRQCYYISLRTADGSPQCQFLTFTGSGELHVVSRKLNINGSSSS